MTKKFIMWSTMFMIFFAVQCATLNGTALRGYYNNTPPTLNENLIGKTIFNATEGYTGSFSSNDNSEIKDVFMRFTSSGLSVWMVTIDNNKTTSNTSYTISFNAYRFTVQEQLGLKTESFSSEFMEDRCFVEESTSSSPSSVNVLAHSLERVFMLVDNETLLVNFKISIASWGDVLPSASDFSISAQEIPITTTYNIKDGALLEIAPSSIVAYKLTVPDIFEHLTQNITYNGTNTYRYQWMKSNVGIWDSQVAQMINPGASFISTSTSMMPAYSGWSSNQTAVILLTNLFNNGTSNYWFNATAGNSTVNTYKELLSTTPKSYAFNLGVFQNPSANPDETDGFLTFDLSEITYDTPWYGSFRFSVDNDFECQWKFYTWSETTAPTTINQKSALNDTEMIQILIYRLDISTSSYLYNSWENLSAFYEQPFYMMHFVKNGSSSISTFSVMGKYLLIRPTAESLGTNMTANGIFSISSESIPEFSSTLPTTSNTTYNNISAGISSDVGHPSISNLMRVWKVPVIPFSTILLSVRTVNLLDYNWNKGNNVYLHLFSNSLNQLSVLSTPNIHTTVTYEGNSYKNSTGDFWAESSIFIKREPHQKGFLILHSTDPFNKTGVEIQYTAYYPMTGNSYRVQMKSLWYIPEQQLDFFPSANSTIYYSAPAYCPGSSVRTNISPMSAWKISVQKDHIYNIKTIIKNYGYGFVADSTIAFLAYSFTGQCPIQGNEPNGAIWVRANQAKNLFVADLTGDIYLYGANFAADCDISFELEDIGIVQDPYLNIYTIVALAGGAAIAALITWLIMRRRLII